MVFSSVPVYLDPPNWQQQQQQQQQQNHDHHHHQIQNHHHPHVPAQAPPPPGGPGPAKPGLMAERARLAKMPQPEAPLKCPRCESTNTKFCYFNNYSLTQPRYFCKTCRRYWTRGGSLRSVPVGGGCRRNKRSSSSASKPSSSKSKPIAAGPADQGPVGLPPPPAPFDHYGLGFPAAFPGEIIFPAEPWRHFPFLGPASYPNSDPAVKVEGLVSDQLGLNNNNNNVGNNNLSRNFLGNIDDDDDHHHHYGTSTITTTGFMGSSNAWTDHLSGFTTSSSTNHNLI